MDTKFRCKQSGSGVNLPEEIVEEIVAKLPVKSVLRLRCVSRSWLSLVDSKSFMEKHLQNWRRRRRGMFNNWFHGDDERWPLLDDPSNNHLTRESSMVGCFNGVLCILREGRIFLWNPATRISINLPKFNNNNNNNNNHHLDDNVTCGFGLDEESGAFKVFACCSNSHNHRLVSKVYSTHTNSWKKVASRSRSRSVSSKHDDHRLGVGVFACGRIHWIPRDNNYYYILYFDLKSEMLGMIELPSAGTGVGGGMWLRERDGCLYVICNHHNNDEGELREGEGEDELLDVWVMGEYGVKDSWIKISTIPIPSDYGFSADADADDEEDIGIIHQRYFYAQTLVSLLPPPAARYMKNELLPS